MDNLLDESGDLGLDLSVIGIVDNFPVILLFVENSVNSENGNNFLGITMNMLLKVNETVFGSCFKGLSQLFVKFLQEIQPLGLNVLFTSQEKLLVSRN